MKEQEEKYRFKPAAGFLAAVITTLLAWYVLLPLVYLADLKILWAAFPWFTWYAGYWNFTFAVLGWGFYLPLAVLTAVSLLLVRGLIGKLPFFRRGGEKQGAFSLMKKALGLFFTAIFVAGLLGALAYWENREFTFTQAPAPFGLRIMKKNCAACHPPYRAFHYIKAPDQWQVTVNRMRNLEGAVVTDEDAGKIVELIKRKNSYSDGYLFTAKCTRCHGKSELESVELTSEEWGLVVDRVARLSPYAYRTDWKKQIIRYLSRTMAVSETMIDKNVITKLRFEKACGYCHQLVLALEPLSPDEDVSAMVRRMRLKAPMVFPEEYERTIAEFVQQLPKDEKKFNHMFPHDRKVEVSW